MNSQPKVLLSRGVTSCKGMLPMGEGRIRGKGRRFEQEGLANNHQGETKPRRQAQNFHGGSLAETASDVELISRLAAGRV